jgi:hypothetical protein
MRQSEFRSRFSLCASISLRHRRQSNCRADREAIPPEAEMLHPIDYRDLSAIGNSADTGIAGDKPS